MYRPQPAETCGGSAVKPAHRHITNSDPHVQNLYRPPIPGPNLITWAGSLKRRGMLSEPLKHTAWVDAFRAQQVTARRR